ncbi:MAG: gamma-glutamyltransferase, partial [Proteobacteria bacterium]|nr:gamma-glutamyltransferase [Pseudomonadota bacterium]
IKQLISKSYAKKLRQSIRLDHATVSTELHNPAVSPGESSSTTHISVVDSSGNAVSTTQTINYSFGSCVVAEGTGIVLNDEMDDFAANPGVPNAFGLVQGEANSISPGKTPLSSMTPTIVFDEQGEVQMVLGSPGGPKIINAVLQTLINAVDFKLSLLDSVHGFRLHHQWLPDQIRYEKGGLTSEEEVGLKRRGHVLVPVGSIGEIAAILKRPEGGWEGVADARAEGKAVGQK